MKPLFISILSVAAALASKLLDVSWVAELAPTIQPETIEVLLEIMAASMLVIATLSVASMVSAYASASNTATPRSFTLIVADDLSQNALSTFVGAFIFSIVALIAMKNGYYGTAGRFVLFVLTLIVFAWVILVFVRWVDGIARLGRLGNTVDKIEAAAARALRRRRDDPLLGGAPVPAGEPSGTAVFGRTVGYVQHIRMDLLQSCATEADVTVRVTAQPGTFATPAQALAWIDRGGVSADDEFVARMTDAFIIGGDRVYDDDPRFGLVVLSEIAGRALSPAINDPGTAIDIIGTFVRLLSEWGNQAGQGDAAAECRHDRVLVPALSLDDIFDDAFTSIARDGAASIEVVVRLQKAFAALAAIDNARMESVAIRHARQSLKRAETSLNLEEDIDVARAAASWVDKR